jgi:hypothetical protein
MLFVLLLHYHSLTWNAHRTSFNCLKMWHLTNCTWHKIHISATRNVLLETFLHGVDLIKYNGEIICSSDRHSPLASGILKLVSFTSAAQGERKKKIRNRLIAVVSKSFRTESIKKFTRTTINTRCEATHRVVAAKFTRLTHQIVIQLHLVAESCTICSSRSRRQVRKLLDTPSYILRYVT